MIPLLNKPNVDAADSEYLYGNIRDREAGQANGTPVNTEVYADIHQFFEKLMADSISVGGAAANGLPDNDYNTRQLNDALYNITDWMINNAANVQEGATWTDITLGNDWVARTSYLGVNYHPPQYMKDVWGWVHLRGSLARSNNSAGVNLSINPAGLLPSTHRPSAEERPTAYAETTNPHGAINIRIMEDGNIVPSGPFTLVDLDIGGYFVSLDNIHFKT